MPVSFFRGFQFWLFVINFFGGLLEIRVTFGGVKMDVSFWGSLKIWVIFGVTKIKFCSIKFADI